MTDNDSSDSSFALKDDGDDDDNNSNSNSSLSVDHDNGDDSDDDDDDDGPVLKSPQRNRQQKKRPIIFDDESDSDDNEKPPPSKKKLKKNQPDDIRGSNNGDGAGGSNNNTKPNFMETLPMDLVENRIWSYLTIDDFYCFGYSSQTTKEYVQKFAKRQGNMEADDIHKRKWLCIDCNCNLFSVKRRIYRKKKNIPFGEKGKKIYEMLAPFSCNCKCGGDEDDDPNCRWLCYNCSDEYTCNSCANTITNYCRDCLWYKCHRCESYVCSERCLNPCPTCTRVKCDRCICCEAFGFAVDG